MGLWQGALVGWRAACAAWHPRHHLQRRRPQHPTPHRHSGAALLVSRGDGEQQVYHCHVSFCHCLVRHYLRLEGSNWLEEARAAFQQVVDSYTANGARNRDLVGHAYARIALIANSFDEEAQEAISLYQEAIALVTPRWQAQYYIDHRATPDRDPATGLPTVELYLRNSDEEIYWSPQWSR